MERREGVYLQAYTCNITHRPMCAIGVTRNMTLDDTKSIEKTDVNYIHAGNA